MAVFPNKKFRGAAEAVTFAAKYRAVMAKYPFLLFGLPFMSIMVAGSFVLTPATAIRYEKHDRRVRQMTRDEELGVGKGGRRVNMKDEYYVGLPISSEASHSSTDTCTVAETGCQGYRQLGAEACEETSW